MLLVLLASLRKDLHAPRIHGVFRQLKHAAEAAKRVPTPRGSIQNPKDFLTAIGRSCETKLNVQSWDSLFTMGGQGMKLAGVGVRDRRYILWSLEKYRQGQDPADFAHPERPKKKVRGWGPAVQFGKRIRSRRHR